MRGRPALVTSYAADQAPLGTWARRSALAALLMVLAMLPFILDAELNALMATAFLSAIAAIGLNIVTGFAGQVSLGHAFFLGLGAYTAAVLSGTPEGRTVGFGLDMAIWLPASGVLPAAIGLIVAPIATRLNLGREVTREANLYYLSLVLLIMLAVLAKNLVRSAVGRGFTAIRDRDIAAEVMGTELAKHKVIAFTVSSFFAGIAGAMLSTVTGYIEPGSYNLLLSVQFLAMILIGGIGSLTGSILGAAFVVLLPRLVEEVPRFLPFITSRSTGGFLTVFQLQSIVYGLLIVVFLIAEPRGLYGLWLRIRNYFKAWPFSY